MLLISNVCNWSKGNKREHALRNTSLSSAEFLVTASSLIIQLGHIVAQKIREEIYKSATSTRWLFTVHKFQVET